jgi:hypothetical protein
MSELKCINCKRPVRRVHNNSGTGFLYVDGGGYANCTKGPHTPPAPVPVHVEEQHRHLITKQGLEKLLPNREAEVRLLVLNGLISLIGGLRTPTGLCYEDICTLILDLL